MAPWRVEYAELGAAHLPDLSRVVRRHEIHVGGAGHDDRASLYGLQSTAEIAAIDLIAAYVAIPIVNLGVPRRGVGAGI